MEREKVKETVVQALRREKVRRERMLYPEGIPDYRDCLLLAACSLLLETLQSKDCDPFMEYNIKTKDYTVWTLTDTDLKIVEKDPDYFVHRLINDYVMWMLSISHDVLRAKNIYSSVISVFQRAMFTSVEKEDEGTEIKEPTNETDDKESEKI